MTAPNDDPMALMPFDDGSANQDAVGSQHRRVALVCGNGRICAGCRKSISRGRRDDRESKRGNQSQAEQDVGSFDFFHGNDSPWIVKSILDRQGNRRVFAL